MSISEGEAKGKTMFRVIGTQRKILLFAVFVFAGCEIHASEPIAKWWLTTADQKRELEEQHDLSFRAKNGEAIPSADRLIVDESKVGQQILGLGSSLDHATCFNLAQLSEEQRRDVLTRLFDKTKGIGINLSRICIGTPDFTPEPWYSYDDLPNGESDEKLHRFSIEKDRHYVLPVLRSALQVNPSLIFFASPWSPPGWMKSTGDLIGGELQVEHYGSYAQYFVKFIQAYREEGIPIHAVTIQNEPGVDRSKGSVSWHYPSCHWTAEQERDFIKLHLGPAFKKAGLTTEIWTYDHNFNEVPTADGDDPGISYPRTVLSDPEAAKYVGGVAFHGYAGKPKGMMTFQREFPAVPVHFTEGSVFGPYGGRLLVEYLRHGASSYNGWVTVLDSDGKPNNGPFRASRTCVTVDSKTKQPKYHYDYFQYGHFFRFIQRGSHRIVVEGGDNLLGAVAFVNPDGETAMVIVNSGGKQRSLTIFWRSQSLELSLPQRSIGTITWNSERKKSS